MTEINRVIVFGDSHTYGDEMEYEFLLGRDEFKKVYKKLFKKTPVYLKDGELDKSTLPHGCMGKLREYNHNMFGVDHIKDISNKNSYAGQLASKLGVEYLNFSKPGNTNTAMHSDFILFKKDFTENDLVIVAYTAAHRTTQYTMDGKTYTRIINPGLPGQAIDYKKVTEYAILHDEFGDDFIATLSKNYGLLWHMQSVLQNKKCKFLFIDILGQYISHYDNTSLRLWDTIKLHDLSDRYPKKLEDFRWHPLINQLYAEYVYLTDIGKDNLHRSNVMIKQEDTSLKTRLPFGHFNSTVHKYFLDTVILPKLREKYDISV